MRKFFLIVFVLLLILAACQTADDITGTDSEDLELIKLPMGYIPNIQYAPFYVAVENGYFAEEGFELEFDYSYETDGLALVGTGEVPFALVSGEQVILARSHEIPVVYVFGWFQDFPTAIIALKETGVESPSDLVGHEIGIPGLFGASYIGLKAILNEVGVLEEDISLNAIGFNQVQLVVGGQVQIIVGYDTNESIVLESMGYEVNVFSASDYVQLSANGIITNEDMIENHPEKVTAFNRAFKKGLEFTINNPDEAFEISKNYVEGLDELDEEIQKKVLTKSIDYWVADNLGYSSPQAWENMLSVLLSMKEVQEPIDLTKAFSNEFIKE
jgi:NitT/TauT family transport system substrate-binding protein